jgi:hypothetical protein
VIEEPLLPFDAHVGSQVAFDIGNRTPHPASMVPFCDKVEMVWHEYPNDGRQVAGLGVYTDGFMKAGCHFIVGERVDAALLAADGYKPGVCFVDPFGYSMA